MYYIFDQKSRFITTIEGSWPGRLMTYLLLHTDNKIIYVISTYSNTIKKIKWHSATNAGDVSGDEAVKEISMSQEEINSLIHRLCG